MLRKITAFLSLAVILTSIILPCYAQNESTEEIHENQQTVENSVETVENPEENAVEVQDSITTDPSGETSESTLSFLAAIPSADSTSEAMKNASEDLEAQKAEEANRSMFDGIKKAALTVKKSFYKTFIVEDRWLMFVKGFGSTVLIALFSTILGVLIGMIIAIVKVLHSQIDRPNALLNILNAVFNLYTTLIRGTPAVVQLFIAYYIIFKTSDNYILVSIFAFGINSGAYVSEIVRGGILSIDRGQLEAGRSLGLSYITTMINIVLPQAIKNILPALGNEFILLLKDTSIAGYIGTAELMKAGNVVRSRTFEPYFSLLSVAAVYLVCVILLEQLIKYFERRLAKSDRH